MSVVTSAGTGNFGALVAAASVEPVGQFLNALGFVSVQVLAPSVYTLTLSQNANISPNDSVAIATVSQNTVAGSCDVVKTSPSTVVVSTFDAAGLPADRGFDIVLIRKAIGP